MSSPPQGVGILCIYIYNDIIIAILLTTYMRQSPTPRAALWAPIPTYNVESARGGGVGTTIDRHIINGCPWVQGARDFSAQQKENCRNDIFVICDASQ